MMREPTIRDLQEQLADLRARIPDHLLLPQPLTGKAPPEVHKRIADAKAAAASVATFPIHWPTGFVPYEWYGPPDYGKASDGRPCWDFHVLGSFYNDKATFRIYTLRFFAPDVAMEVVTPPYALLHGGVGCGDGAPWLAGWGEQGAYFQSVSGFRPALGDEHNLSAQPLAQQLAAINEQLTALTKRVAALEQHP